MYISELKIANFRQIRDAEIGPFRAPAGLGELIVLAGPNGSGKSSVLELLSFGIANRYSWQYYQSRRITEHSFAVRIGLTEEELRQLEESGADPESTQYARDRRGYWMEVNMPDAFDHADREINERVHGLVSRQFQNFTRKLGFFLRADRGYGARTYNSRQLFNYKNRLQPQHFNQISFGQTAAQYEDMYDFLVEQSYHYVYNLGLHHKSLADGVPGDPPEDPIQPYNELLGRLFPDYSFVDATTDQLSLRVRLPTGDVLPFEDLSSGEKEVFFILSFFIRNDISDSIVIIDEPELHLHPELARKLMQLMRTIKPQNQIWCATHSAELIDEAGRDRTFYLRMSDDRRRAVCVPATGDGADIDALRDLFGYSGYVGISKKVVFSEGKESGTDRRVFSNVLPNLAQEIRIIPVGSWENLYRLNRAILALLESDFARCQFYLIRDRDYLSPETVQKHAARTDGRLFILSRYHIENYLLDDRLLAAVLGEIYQVTMTPEQVRETLYGIAKENSAGFLRDMVAFRFGELYQSEDCSIGRHSEGQSLIVENGQISEEILQHLRTALFQKADAVNAEVLERVGADRRVAVFDACLGEVQAALADGSEGWRSLFPGRYILKKFSASRGLGTWPSLQNILIDRVSRGDIPLDHELRTIFEAIAAD